MTRSRQQPSDNDTRIVEHEGMLWKPRPGATATFEEFQAARTRFFEVDEHVSWNPWDRHLRDKAAEALLTVGDQWIRAEPGFRYMTKAEHQAHMDQWDADYKAEQQRTKAERQERAQHYDPEREKARLHLLEDEAFLRHVTKEAEEVDTGQRLPLLAVDRRAAMLGELRGKIEKYQARVDQFKAQVGDPEMVMDSHGWLPAERRQIGVSYFSVWRQREVTELRERVDQVTQELKNTTGRSERAAVRKKSWLDEYMLKGLLAVTRPAAEEMCSECQRPQAWDSWSSSGLIYVGPCPAWPGWAARIAKTREMFFQIQPRTPARPAAPKPQPLAVVPSGLPISEVIERLAHLQTDFPDGQVKRGRANRWEIWPMDNPPA